MHSLFNSLPNTKFLDMTKLKAFADNKLNLANMISLFDRVENTGKRQKCWLQAFSALPTVFSKDLFFRVVYLELCDRVTYHHMMPHFDALKIYSCGEQ